MADMKTEEDKPQPGLFGQVCASDGILPLAAISQTWPDFPAGAQRVGICVSIIEDDPQTSQILSDGIRRAEGFCLLSYHSTPDSALTALPQERPAIVLIDIGLPGFSALNCVRQLKPVLQQTQFVMLLADQDAEHIFNALGAGASGYLLKQTPHTEVLAALQDIHAGGSPINSEIAKRVLHFFHHQSSQSAHAAAELSPRENRMLRLLASGSSFNEVAENLRISLLMVRTYIRSIYEKLHLQTAS